MYLLDSNIYINFYDRYYRKDFFPTFWVNFVDILNANVVIPKIIRELSRHLVQKLVKEELHKIPNRS